MSAVFGEWGSEIPPGLELAETKDLQEQNVGQKLRYDFRSSGIGNVKSIFVAIFSCPTHSRSHSTPWSRAIEISDTPNFRTRLTVAAYRGMLRLPDANALLPVVSPEP